MSFHLQYVSIKIRREVSIDHSEPVVLVGCFRTALLASSGQKSEKAGEKFAPVVNFVANVVVDVGDRKLWRFGHFVPRLGHIRHFSAMSGLRRVPTA